jgi:hypothetical protein
MMRKRPYAIITFCPLRKNPLTGQIEKLTKFSIKLDVTGDRQTKKLAKLCCKFSPRRRHMV